MDWPASEVGYVNLTIDAGKVEVRNNLMVNGDHGSQGSGHIAFFQPVADQFHRSGLY